MPRHVWSRLRSNSTVNKRVVGEGKFWLAVTRSTPRARAVDLPCVKLQWAGALAVIVILSSTPADSEGCQQDDNVCSGPVRQVFALANAARFASNLDDDSPLVLGMRGKKDYRVAEKSSGSHGNFSTHAQGAPRSPRASKAPHRTRNDLWRTHLTELALM